uniref:Uncharacterized protein n=1 Tax=viral metagenome TaxID=1070528 RepID=A0A6C0BF07_9ZZZZ
MKSIILFIFFAGIIMLIHGIYDQKYKTLQQNVRVEYRFIPRTYYEEQLAENPNVASNYKNMFQKESPWFERNVGMANPMKETNNPNAK